MEALTITVLTLYVFITAMIFNKSVDRLIQVNRKERKIIEAVAETKNTRFGFGRQRANSCPI
jgi:hypothetical protein